jgi:hypothetical protein
MLVELPCGILYNDTVYDRVIVKELTGKQQNYLIDMDLVSGNIGHIPKLLEDLTYQFQTAEGLPLNMPLKDAIWLLPSEDIELILLKIREETFGNIMALPTICPHCEKKQMKKIELDKLDIVRLKDKKIRTQTIDLPKCQKQAEIKLIYLRDMFDLYKNFSDKEKHHTLFTSTLVVSLKKLGDKSPVTELDLQDIAVSDLKLIEDTFVNLRASLDTQLTHTCEGCNQEYPGVLPVTDPSFFVQSTTPSI